MKEILDKLKAEALFFLASSTEKKENKLCLLKKASELDPSHPGILILLGNLCIISCEYDQGKNILIQALELMPENPVIYQYLGIERLYQKDVSSASSYFKLALDKEKNNQLSKNYLSLCRILNGDIKKGINDIKNTGVYSNSRYCSFLMQVVEKNLLLLSAGRETNCSLTQKAEQNNDMVENIAPEENNEPIQNRKTTTALDEISKSEELTKKVVKHGLVSSLVIVPILSFVYWLLGSRYTSSNRFDKAVKCFERIVELAPTTERIHFYLGEACFYSGDFKKAYKNFRIAFETDGESPEVLYYLGKIFQEDKNYNEAKEYLLKSLAVFPKSPETLYSLGQISLALNEIERAQSYFLMASDYDVGYIMERMAQLEQSVETSKTE